MCVCVCMGVWDDDEEKERKRGTIKWLLLPGTVVKGEKCFLFRGIDSRGTALTPTFIAL